MSMTEPTTTPPKPKRPYHKRANKPQSVKALPAEFSGLTAKTCCADCNENRCVISGINVCAHPLKGGIQTGQRGDPKVSARFARAKAALE